MHIRLLECKSGFCGEFVHISNHKIEDRMVLEKAACQRCSDSLAIIYDKYQSVVHDYLKRSGADGMSEDICQTVFVRLSQGKYNYDKKTDVDNYLCVVAKNILRNHQKVKTEILYSPTDIEAISANQSVGVELDMLEAEEELQLLKTLIAELPPKSRHAIELVFMSEGNTGGSTWDQSSDNPDALRMRLRYAIKLLRGKFTDT